MAFLGGSRIISGLTALSLLTSPASSQESQKDRGDQKKETPSFSIDSLLQASLPSVFRGTVEKDKKPLLVDGDSDLAKSLTKACFVVWKDVTNPGEAVTAYSFKSDYTTGALKVRLTFDNIKQGDPGHIIISCRSGDNGSFETIASQVISPQAGKADVNFSLNSVGEGTEFRITTLPNFKLSAVAAWKKS